MSEDIQFSFCIVTGYQDTERLSAIIENISLLRIPDYEVLIIGGGRGEYSHTNLNVRFIDFDESIKPLWITKKKNILATEAKYENLVVMHDYHIFDSDWYENFKAFGVNWDICSCPQYLITGARNPMDWSLWDKPGHGRAWSLDYNDWTQTKYMYISGGFFIVKKHVILEEPLNESLGWNEEEDVEWSMRVRDKYVMKCNGKSVVRHNKWHRHAGAEPK
jgi:hypothetical protein